MAISESAFRAAREWTVEELEKRCPFHVVPEFIPCERYLESIAFLKPFLCSFSSVFQEEYARVKECGPEALGAHKKAY